MGTEYNPQWWWIFKSTTGAWGYQPKDISHYKYMPVDVQERLKLNLESPDVVSFHGTKQAVRKEVGIRNNLLNQKPNPNPSFQGKFRFVYRRLAPQLQGWVLEEMPKGMKKVGGTPEFCVKWLKEKLDVV